MYIPGASFKNENVLTAIWINAQTSNYIYVNQYGAIKLPCLNFNDSLVKLPLKLGIYQ